MSFMNDYTINVNFEVSLGDMKLVLVCDLAKFVGLSQVNNLADLFKNKGLEEIREMYKLSCTARHKDDFADKLKEFFNIKELEKE